MAVVISVDRNILDLRDSCENATFSDCIIKSSDSFEFKLHRVILSGASKVFKAMFSSNMKEGIAQVIELSEDSNLLRNMFKVIYLGESEVLTCSECIDLTIVADKYLIKDLHNVCKSFLVRFGEHPANAVELLKYAEASHFDELRTQCLEVIGRNFESIRNSAAWSILMEDANLMNGAIDAYIKDTKAKTATPSYTW